MEKEILKKIEKTYCKREEFIILLNKICNDNNINDTYNYIKGFLDKSVSKSVSEIK